MSQVAPLHPRVVYQPPTGDSNKQADIAVGYFQLDLTQLVNEQGVALTNAQMLGQGRDMQVSGDWIAVDSGALGALRAAPHSRLTDDDSVLLTPGKIYHRKFHNLRVFYSKLNGAAPLAPGGAALPVIFRAFFGTGPIPFNNLPFNADAQLMGPPQGSSSATPSVASAEYFATEGCVFDFSLRATLATSVAGNTAILRASLHFDYLVVDQLGVGHPGSGGLGTEAGNAPGLEPDFETFVDVVPAALGTARVFAKWNRVIVPRNVIGVILKIDNLGTEATNNISLVPSAILH